MKYTFLLDTSSVCTGATAREICAAIKHDKISLERAAFSRHTRCCPRDLEASKPV